MTSFLTVSLTLSNAAQQSYDLPSTEHFCAQHTAAMCYTTSGCSEDAENAQLHMAAHHKQLSLLAGLTIPPMASLSFCCPLEQEDRA